MGRGPRCRRPHGGAARVYRAVAPGGDPGRGRRTDLRPADGPPLHRRDGTASRGPERTGDADHGARGALPGALRRRLRSVQTLWGALHRHRWPSMARALMHSLVADAPAIPAHPQATGRPWTDDRPSEPGRARVIRLPSLLPASVIRCGGTLAGLGLRPSATHGKPRDFVRGPISPTAPSRASSSRDAAAPGRDSSPGSMPPIP